MFSVDVLEGEDSLGVITQATHEGTATGFNLQDGAVIIRRVYADRSVSVTGTCLFSPDTYDLSLEQGWNFVLETFNEVEPGAFGIDGATGAVPVGAGWFFVAD